CGATREPRAAWAAPLGWSGREARERARELALAAQLDLTDALAAEAHLAAELAERARLVGHHSLLHDPALAVGEVGQRARELLAELLVRVGAHRLRLRIGRVLRREQIHRRRPRAQRTVERHVPSLEH